MGGRKERRMKEYIVEDMTGEFEDKDYQELIRCKDCEYHGKRTNICDIFHCQTNPNGYCHRGRIYGQTESGTKGEPVKD